MENVNNDGNVQGRAIRGNRDDIWKDQIRQAIEESRRNIERQQAEQRAPGYRITLNAPHVTKNYYELVRSDTRLISAKKSNLRHLTNSDSAIAKKRQQSANDRDRYGSRNATDSSNVASTSTSRRYSRWPRYGSAVSHKATKKGKRHVKESESQSATTLQTEDEDASYDVTTPGESETVDDNETGTVGDTGDVLSYFDPHFVKEEFKEILSKSRNIVIGPPREILRKYFGLTDEYQFPQELKHDNSPKAFILPRKMWKDYDDGHVGSTLTHEVQPTISIPSRHDDDISSVMYDKRLLKKLEEEKEVEPFIPRQPKNVAVEYLSRRPFKKHGMISSNLNDASPNMMEHLEMKDVNVDPGGQLRRDLTEKQFKISDVTDTPVKVAEKEGEVLAHKRPWYVEEWTDGADPKLLTKSPNFITGKDDVEYPDKDQDEKPKSPSSSGSSESSSSGSGYSCTCGDSTTSSGSGSSSGRRSSGSSASDRSRSEREDTMKRSKGKRKRGHKDGEQAGEPDTKDIAVDANMLNEDVPSWAPASWKPPPGYKGWIYNKKLETSQSAPETSVKFDDRSSRLPGSDWFRAFGVVKKAEKEGTIDSLRHIIGYVEGEDDLLKLEEELEHPDGDEEEDPMERLPRDDIPSRRQYPEYPKSEHVQYYRSYPLYPTLSNERYYEWYKDMHRLINPFGRKIYPRPAGLSKSMGSINWDDPKEASKWYSYGYRRPDTRPKPERADYNTKDYIYDNARSIMLMPSRKIIPKYVDDRNGTTHFLEPSGLVKKFIFRDDFGKVPDYLMGRNEELGRPPYPDMDKFYRPHRCKYLHGHTHCKICMRAYPTATIRRPSWNCDMLPTDYEKTLEYRNNKQYFNTSASTQYVYTPSSHGKSTSKARMEYDVESILNDVGLGDEYRRSKAARKNQNLSSTRSNLNSQTYGVVLPPVYV